MKKNEKKMSKKLKLYEVIFFVVVILLLLFIVIKTFAKPKTYDDFYCKKAICNDDNTSCYVYELDENDKTKVVWKGDCSK